MARKSRGVEPEFLGEDDPDPELPAPPAMVHVAAIREVLDSGADPRAKCERIAELCAAAASSPALE